MLHGYSCNFSKLEGPRAHEGKDQHILLSYLCKLYAIYLEGRKKNLIPILLVIRMVHNAGGSIIIEAVM